MVSIDSTSLGSAGRRPLRAFNAPAPVPMGYTMGLTSRFDDVLAAAQHGSEWGWQQLLGEYGPAVQAYARTQGVLDPEDLLGQVLEGVVRGISRFKGSESAFRSWVFTIAHSRIIDDRRRTRRRPQMSDHDVPDVPTLTADVHDESVTLSREAALELLDKLPPKQRDVIALRVVAGLSVDQTAQVLNRRAGSIRVAMHRALQTLEDTNPTGDVTP
jgi:RNA polymerase sigma factor (sigma-70 family)